MTINISNTMLDVIIDALRCDVEHGKRTYGFATDYETTNEEALALFEDIREDNEE